MNHGDAPDLGLGAAGAGAAVGTIEIQVKMLQTGRVMNLIKQVIRNLQPIKQHYGILLRIVNLW